MGWLDPERGFLSTQNANQVVLYGPLGTAATAKKVREISGAEIREVQRNHIACEVPPTGRLTAFDVGQANDADRAIYTTKKLPGESRSGLISIPLKDPDMEAVNRVLGWPESGALRRDEAIGVRAGSFFYSLHKLYSPTTGLLRQEAIILHGRSGQLIALELKRGLDSAAMCDGCWHPTYFESRFEHYRPLNLFELPGFPYPVLLLDTSSVEGRALSLVTFTPTGMKAEFRVYEYVVNCR